MFVNFPGFCLLLIPSFMAYGWKRYFCDSSLLKFIEICFVAQCIGSPGECFMCTWEESVVFCGLCNVCIYLLGLVGLNCCSYPVFPYQSLDMLHSLLKMAYWCHILELCSLLKSFMRLWSFGYNSGGSELISMQNSK
jgi:hypothetical protein